MYKILILICINYAAALESRIVNGRDALPGEVGYIVSVQEYLYHKCGGSIINEYNVLTAARCFQGHVTIHYIQYGVLKIVPDYVNYIHVHEVLIHENFDAIDFLKHDIAILMLSSPLPFDSFSVTPISLPTQGEEFAANTWARVAGWGSVDKMDEALSEHLQTTIMYILSMQKCKIPYDWCLHEEGQICVSNGGSNIRRGACTGDIGSPLVVKMINGQEKLAGVYSWSFNHLGSCGFKMYPDVFTKVSHYVNWIEEQLSI